jgi:hypothetical protein
LCAPMRASRSRSRTVRLTRFSASTRSTTSTIVRVYFASVPGFVVPADDSCSQIRSPSPGFCAAMT